MNIGIIPGAMKPLHRGHEFLINKSLNENDETYIVMSGASRAKGGFEITGDAAVKVIKNHYIPHVPAFKNAHLHVVMPHPDKKLETAIRNANKAKTEKTRSRKTLAARDVHNREMSNYTGVSQHVDDIENTEHGMQSFTFGHATPVQQAEEIVRQVEGASGGGNTYTIYADSTDYPRYRFIERLVQEEFPDSTVQPPSTMERGVGEVPDISGTQVRQILLQGDEESFIKLLPTSIPESERRSIFQELTGKTVTSEGKEKLIRNFIRQKIISELSR